MSHVVDPTGVRSCALSAPVEVLNPPSRADTAAVKQQSITRALAFHTDETTRYGRTVEHLCLFQNMPPVTIWGVFEEAEVVRVTTCRHGNFPDVVLNGVTMMYCYRCSLYLPAGTWHDMPAVIAAAVTALAW